MDNDYLPIDSFLSDKEEHSAPVLREVSYCDKMQGVMFNLSEVQMIQANKKPIILKIGEASVLVVVLCRFPFYFAYTIPIRRA